MTDDRGLPADRVSHGAQAEQVVRDALWNSAAAAMPAALVSCRTRSDVERAVRVAADRGLPVSVLAGGHDGAGRAVRAGGIVLDLRAMVGVAVDGGGASVTVGGGITTKAMLAALPDDLAVVTGAWTSIGVVGVATGGGYGNLNRRFGLAADGILRAEVVLADGSVAIAGEDDDAELLWALRGGCCNFGAVTSMTFAAHRLPRVLSAGIFVPLADMAKALPEVQALLDAEDDALSIHGAIATVPSLGRGLVLNPLWVGEEAEGERRMEAVARLTGARRLKQGWSPFRDTFDERDEAAFPKGGDYLTDAHNVPRYDQAVAGVLVDAARRFPSDHDVIILHDLFGAATRVPADATAFAMREPHINVQVVAGRDPEGDGDGQRRARWLADVRAAFGPWLARGAYANFLPPQFRADARRFYGAALPRLERAKAAYDPDDRFDSNPGHLG